MTLNHFLMSYILILFVLIQNSAEKELVHNYLIFAEDIAKKASISKVSLNVETEKDAAIRLYKRSGYEIVSPWTIIGEPFHHMVKNV